MEKCKAAFAKQLQFSSKSFEISRLPTGEDENLKQRYKETIDVDVQKGFLRILDEAERENTKSDLQCYVPLC